MATLPLRPVLLALLLCPALASCAMPAVDCEARHGVEVEIVRHRWHTGIIVPREQLGDELAFLGQQFPDARWFEIGWGDREFYRKPDSTWLIIRSLFWPTASALHVVGLEKPAPELPHRDLLTLTLSPEEMARLRRAISADFQRRRGETLRIEPGLYGNSWFYEARGRFWFARTCNTWTAERMAGAGVPLRSFMTLTADSVMEQLRDAREEAACLRPETTGEKP